MNTNSTTTLPCAGCNRYLGDVMQPLVVDFDGWRYRVCAYGCANRLLARLSPPSTTTTPAISDTTRLYGLDGYRRWP
jgi:hypothetical protein